MQVSVNNNIRGKKVRNTPNQPFLISKTTPNQHFDVPQERRRNSLERPFQGDYIAYRENFALKAIVEANGKEKVAFADRVNKWSRYAKRDRRTLILTNSAIYVIAIVKNMVRSHFFLNSRK